MPPEALEKRYYILQTAIDAKRKVKIRYRGYNRDSDRIIHPYKLFKFSNWIVFAYDEDRSRKGVPLFNKFKLHRMLAIEILEENYTVHPEYREVDYFDQQGVVEPLTHVVLKIHGKMGRMLDEKIYGQNQRVTCLDANRHIYLFEADMRNQLVIRKFILSFGSRCEVLEPESIREEMLIDAKRTMQRYERNNSEEKIKFFFTEQSLCNKYNYHGVSSSEKGANFMKIQGKYSEATIYTSVIEESALQQIQALCDQDAFAGAKIRIMPDVHTGKGCVIGFTADLGSKVIPNIVGVDIGCGMLTVQLGTVDIDLEALDRFITSKIPNGKAINEHQQVDFMETLERLRLLKSIRQDLKKWNRAIGSLGGGNHFIEINVDDSGSKYLVIHSGSRNLGHVVATHYQNEAIAYHSGYNEAYLAERQQLIATLKDQGRRTEIQAAIQQLKRRYHRESTLPDTFCYLEGQLREDYLHDMAICQAFAELNRDTMANRILMHLFGHNNFERFHTTHNFIDFSDNIVRKGAIQANAGQRVLIPINMRDGSILAVGKGNPEWNNSAPHGAGRLMSRTTAFDTIDFKDFQEEMKGIYSSSVTPKTLDESPMAYKSLADIVDNIGETVEILAILKPIYNFKSQN